jgi:hypothetical protein
VLVTPEPPGINCAAGGLKVQTGLDLNGDGILEPNEVQDTQYVCNGVSAASSGSSSGASSGSSSGSTGTGSGSSSGAPGLLVVSPVAVVALGGTLQLHAQYDSPMNDVTALAKWQVLASEACPAQGSPGCAVAIEPSGLLLGLSPGAATVSVTYSGLTVNVRAYVPCSTDPSFVADNPAGSTGQCTGGDLCCASAAADNMTTVLGCGATYCSPSVDGGLPSAEVCSSTFPCPSGTSCVSSVSSDTSVRYTNPPVSVCSASP